VVVSRALPTTAPALRPSWAATFFNW
jgi:hypothetical protein